MAIGEGPGSVTTYDAKTPLRRREEVIADPRARLERMMEIRHAEQKIRELHEEGLAWGSTHSCDGQEAVAVGIAAAVPPTDHVVGAHRGHGLGLAMGLTPEQLLGETLGRSVGAVEGLGGSPHLVETSVGLVFTVTLMGAGIPIVAGLALAAQVQGSDQVAVAVFGDGAVNIGAFHEGLNLAALWRLPAVFIIENNHYGEFSRYDRTTTVEPPARRAEAYGLPWTLVDGQDVDAVIEAVGTAVATARSGGGPTLLELRTYRYFGHSRSDRAPYRPEGELEAWRARDPIRILGDRLVADGVVDEADLAAMEERCRERVEAAAAHALAAPVTDVTAMFRHVYPEAAP